MLFNKLGQLCANYMTFVTICRDDRLMEIASFFRNDDAAIAIEKLRTDDTKSLVQLIEHPDSTVSSFESYAADFKSIKSLNKNIVLHSAPEDDVDKLMQELVVFVENKKLSELSIQVNGYRADASYRHAVDYCASSHHTEPVLGHDAVGIHCSIVTVIARYLEEARPAFVRHAVLNYDNLVTLLKDLRGQQNG